MISPKSLAISLFALASVHASTEFKILDQYVNSVPKGTTSYNELTYYTRYVDAESANASPFVIDLLTSPRQADTGILFYGETELNSKDRANTFRLTSTTGLFDFISFNLQELEPYSDGEQTATSIPTITITSSTGFTQTFSATVDIFEFEFEFDGEMLKFISYSYPFEDPGVKTMNWSGVEWVDITTQYTKAKTSDFVLATALPVVPEYLVTTKMNQLLPLAVAKIIAQVDDSNQGAVSLTGVTASSQESGTVALAENTINYTPPLNFVGEDRFVVTLTGTSGLQLQATIVVTVTGTPQNVAGNQSKLSIVGGKPVIEFRGIPGRSYTIERSEGNLEVWVDVDSIVAGPDGIMVFTDQNPPEGGSAFYRTKN